MDPVFLNLEEKADPPAPIKKRRRPWRIFFFVLLGILGLSALAGGASLVMAYGFASGIDNSVIEGENKDSVIQQLTYLVATPDKPLQGEVDGRINILVLGMGGEGHSGGAYLTDTIIVASIDPETKKVGMLSIPRDLAVDTGGGQYRKINNAYAWGDIDLAKKLVEQVTGLTMHYYVTVDFDGFRDVIDNLGGIDVTVDNAFTDYEYPDYHFGYQTVSFQTGQQTMNGERALQFARSRHGNNEEGSDFARSRRQQKVIMAIRDKFLSKNTLLNPTVISDVLATVGDHVSTNAELWELSRFAQLAKDIDTASVQTQVLDAEDTGVVHSMISAETGAYILVPDAGLGKYWEIQEIAANLLQAAREPVTEQATVEVQNGTMVEGLARKISSRIETNGITVGSYKNATERGQEVTVIYDLSGGTKPETLARLEELLGANSSTATPTWLTTNTNTATPTADIIVVLGIDQSSN